jgi:hypothetical protein
MTTTQTPEMLDELLRVTTPAQPRIDYDTLRARYEWLCSNLGKLYRVEALRRAGAADGDPVDATRFEFRKWDGCVFDPASVDALVAKAMKGEG